MARTGGFCLVCAQAQWNKDGWIGEHLEELLSALDGEKVAAVRQDLAALHQRVHFQPKLCPRSGKSGSGSICLRRKRA